MSLGLSSHVWGLQRPQASFSCSTHSQARVKEEVMTVCLERFDRRIAEEVSGLRVQIAQSESTLRGDIAAGRVEFIKWSFIFWVGQALAVTGILTVLLRVVR